MAGITGLGKRLRGKRDQASPTVAAPTQPAGGNASPDPGAATPPDDLHSVLESRKGQAGIDELLRLSKKTSDFVVGSAEDTRGGQVTP